MSETVKTLRPDFDLRYIDNGQLADTMRDLCESYDQCYHEMSTATGTVWESIERVAKEIVRRTEPDYVNELEKLTESDKKRKSSRD
ncbi:hypothetical protein J2755_000283 [Methanohalophilus levihalophilus]|uniref:hypothetical protein n=1 Tax=Methanohalophilus levihalophilus TaxID=1431282 RepID=UPI001AE87724|nr:hypothetical protein [Methanohalophilus levihalophilus]MBP2029363.1 hypothetical protein [Methanohalophilus levihalophilus]